MIVEIRYFLRAAGRLEARWCLCMNWELDRIIYRRGKLQPLTLSTPSIQLLLRCSKISRGLFQSPVTGVSLMNLVVFQSQDAVCPVPLFRGELRMYTRPETGFWHRLGPRLLGFCGKSVVCFLKNTLKHCFVKVALPQFSLSYLSLDKSVEDCCCSYSDRTVVFPSIVP